MPLFSRFKSFFSLMTLLVLLFAGQIVPTHAFNGPYVSVIFASEIYGQTTIGRSFPLTIRLGAGENPIRATSLRCSHQSSAIVASSISRLPDSMTFAAYEGFVTEQYYRAVAPGSDLITCVFEGVDLVTGIPFSVKSGIFGATLNVSSETRLYVNTSTASKTPTVGQAIFVMVNYGNRGPSTLTNVQVECWQLGAGFSIVSKRQNQTTLRSNQSGFAEYRLKAEYSGPDNLFLCQVTAIDSSTNEQVYLLAPVVRINII